MRIRILTVVAITAIAAAVAGLAAPNDAKATSTASYYASFPPGECAQSAIKILAPQSVSASAGDTKIAWRALLWRYTNGAWVYTNSALPVQYANVVGGAVYAPYNQGGSFTIYTAGYYAVTVQVYSYGLRQWFGFNLMLRVSDAWGNQNQAGWCSYGV